MTSFHIAAIDSDLFRRVCGEFLEMPGLQLTCEQAMRLWGLGRPECSLLLDVLVSAHFLCHSRHGTFKRSTDGPIENPWALILPPGAGGALPQHACRSETARSRTSMPDTAQVDG